MDRIAAHLRIEPRAVQRHRLGEQPHAAFGGVVGRKVVPADQARDRGQVDDRAAALLEQRQAVLAAEKRAVEIDREDLPPGGEIGLLDVAERRETRGIDQAVEPVVRRCRSRRSPAASRASEVTSSAWSAPGGRRDRW